LEVDSPTSTPARRSLLPDIIELALNRGVQLKEYPMDTARTTSIPPRVRRRSFPLASLRPMALGVVCAAIAAGAANPLVAQQPGTVVHGVVLDSEGRPLANAQVLVAGTALHTLSQRDGRFRLNGVPSGSQSLEAHFVGYRKLQLTVELERDHMVRVDLVMELEPVPVEEIEATALSALPGEIQGFYERRSRGSGHFFTREQIDKMRAHVLTDVLRRVPGVQIVSVNGRFGNSQNVQIGRSVNSTGYRTCPVVFYMNGSPFPVGAEMGINAFVRPTDIAALEVYSGASSIPPQFNSSSHGSRCGVIVIWTRGGERPLRQAS
jgi:TonB-dependent starch-binding outer membrane protein SusC